jgi:hypothetical protein
MPPRINVQGYVQLLLGRVQVPATIIDIKGFFKSFKVDILYYRVIDDGWGFGRDELR